MSDEPVPHVAAKAVAAERAAGKDVFILDVREAFELDLARVPGTVDIPMHDVPPRVHELPRDRQIVVMCHSGVRSLAVARFLVEQGFDAANLTGGISAWADDVDDGVGRY